MLILPNILLRSKPLPVQKHTSIGALRLLTSRVLAEYEQYIYCDKVLYTF